MIKKIFNKVCNIFLFKGGGILIPMIRFVDETILLIEAEHDFNDRVLVDD